MGVFAVFQRVWRTGLPEFFPSALYRDEHDPGTWRESWVFKLESGEVVAIYNDVTWRKVAENARRESDARFSDLFETVTSGVAIYEVRNDGLSGKDYIIKDFQ